MAVGEDNVEFMNFESRVAKLKVKGEPLEYLFINAFFPPVLILEEEGAAKAFILNRFVCLRIFFFLAFEMALFIKQLVVFALFRLREFPAAVLNEQFNSGFVKKGYINERSSIKNHSQEDFSAEIYKEKSACFADRRIEKRENFFLEELKRQGLGLFWKSFRCQSRKRSLFYQKS
ncbi:Hypothetical protein Minf_1571 [Methylacidiphilum infernorum V4]|uniref:Uncharacterized protein n=1 Tax=Methylacidiphilum infernorum (isolate V4) TaxID=481448 RepID=B3DWC2_METI4|nr:Hypothetical protein Minf_1571 [Methylacidiphilum infernorum V4]